MNGIGLMISSSTSSLLLYKKVMNFLYWFCILLLCWIGLSDLRISWWSLQDLLSIRSHHLKIRICWLPLLFVSHFFFPLAFLTLVKILNTLLNKSRVNTLVSFLILEEMPLVFTTECDDGCRIVLYSLYCVEIWSLYTWFRDFIRKGCWILSKVFPPSSVIIM
jgi:hypothetical protein